MQPSDFEPIVYTSSSFVETSAEPNSQIEAPGLLECDCSLIPANPLGRPDSEYHQGRLERANEPTALKFEHLTQNVRNPNSKVEDTVATLLSSSTETNNWFQKQNVATLNVKFPPPDGHRPPINGGNCSWV